MLSLGPLKFNTQPDMKNAHTVAEDVNNNEWTLMNQAVN